MCKIGDLIVVYNPSIGHRSIGRHAFIVLDDSNGIVSGIYEYDFISLMLTSYVDGDNERKNKLGAYQDYLHIAKDDKLIDDPRKSENRNTYVEAANLFYFHKDKIKYRKFGRLDEDVFNLIIEFMGELQEKGIDFNQITDRAKRIE